MLRVRTGARRAVGQGRQDKCGSLSREAVAVICSQQPDTWRGCHALVLELKGLIRQSLNKLLSRVKCSSVLKNLQGMHNISLAKITAYFTASS